MPADDTVYINGRFSTQPLSGVQRYAHEIVTQLDVLAGERAGGMRYLLLTPRGAPPLRLVHIEQRWVGRLKGHFWDQLSFASAARDGVALSLAMTGPALHQRHLVVIHDAAVQRHPEHFSRPYSFVHGRLDRLLARTATIATVSRFSRDELADLLAVPSGSIVVAPNGWQHMQIEPDIGIVDRLGLGGKPFFLVLGNLTRNKNLAVVLRALDRLGPGAVSLVAVGAIDRTTFGTGPVVTSRTDLCLPGRLSDSEVSGLMRAARALIFPSIYEGFGIPPLEALVNRCPVLASTAVAVREVCGQAADYFDPHDDARLAALMQMVLADEGAWRERKLAHGAARLALYSWRRSAETLAEACARLAGVKRMAAA